LYPRTLFKQGRGRERRGRVGGRMERRDESRDGKGGREEGREGREGKGREGKGCVCIHPSGGDQRRCMV
jgi:hypothetical protein